MPLLYLLAYIKMDCSLVLVKPTTEWTKDETAVGRAHSGGCQEAGFTHVAVFPKEYLTSRGYGVSHLCPQLSTLCVPCIPSFSECRIELGFEVKQYCFLSDPAAVILWWEFSSPPKSCFPFLSPPLSLLPPPLPAYSTQLPCQKQFLSISFPKEMLPLFNCLNK